MFDDTSTITRPTNGVVPAATVPAAGSDAPRATAGDDSPQILSDPAFDRQHEVDRCNQMVRDSRFRLEAIALALATIDRYNPADHKLTSHISSYHRLFRAVAPCEYGRCRNVRAAADLLDMLIAERAS